MKINIHTDGIIITSKQKAIMEKKLSRMKRYTPDENMNIDLLLKDETSVEKGGVDQSVHINATFGKEKIFIEEVDDRLLRSFAVALKRFERQLSRYHRKKIDAVKHGGGGRFEKLLKVIKRKKK